MKWLIRKIFLLFLLLFWGLFALPIIIKNVNPSWKKFFTQQNLVPPAPSMPPLSPTPQSILNDYWSDLKLKLQSYAGYQFDTITITNKTYTLTHLWTKSTDPSHPVGSTFDGKAKEQLQALINSGSTTQDVLDKINQLNQLHIFWNQIKVVLRQHSPQVFILIGQRHKFSSLFLFQEQNQDLFSNLSSAAKIELQFLFWNQITVHDIENALSPSTNTKLITLWNNLKIVLRRYTFNLIATVQIPQKGSFPINHLFNDQKQENLNNLSDASIAQLETLITNDVTAKDIATYLNSLVKAEETKEEQSTKQQNLAIGLGTLVGSVALAGAGGFAYWFLKIRKS